MESPGIRPGFLFIRALTNIHALTNIDTSALYRTEGGELMCSLCAETSNNSDVYCSEKPATNAPLGC
jgi:hypothetical protein